MEGKGPKNTLPLLGPRVGLRRAGGGREGSFVWLRHICSELACSSCAGLGAGRELSSRCRSRPRSPGVHRGGPGPGPCPCPGDAAAGGARPVPVPPPSALRAKGLGQCSPPAPAHGPGVSARGGRHLPPRKYFFPLPFRRSRVKGLSCGGVCLGGFWRCVGLVVFVFCFFPPFPSSRRLPPRSLFAVRPLEEPSRQPRR